MKAVIVMITLLVLISCDRPAPLEFNNPLDPMSSEYIGEAAANEIYAAADNLKVIAGRYGLEAVVQQGQGTDAQSVLPDEVQQAEDQLRKVAASYGVKVSVTYRELK